MTHPTRTTDQPDRPDPVEPAAGPTATARPRRRTGRRLLAVTGLVGLAVVAWVAWLAVDAVRARADLESAAAGVRDLQTQVLAGDRAAAEATLASLQSHAAGARERTHGPHWSLAGVVPRVGPTVRAVQTVSEVVDDLAADALPALMDATALVDPAGLAPVDGRIDLAPLVEAAPQVVGADRVVRESLAAVRAIDVDSVVPAVARQVAPLEGQLADVAMTTATAARAVQLLPPMLGSEGPREYLLLIQNNAELRATGGIPGSVVHLRTEGGSVEVVGQRSGGSLGELPAPVVPITTAEQALFGDRLVSDMRDVTFTPHFPRSGEIARAIWQGEVGGAVDGVLSIDPGALAHVLGATGPVELVSGRQLTSDNAIRLLLSTVYLEIRDPQQQDAFFAETADTVFDAMVSGQGEAAATVDALARSAREGRLMVWSARPEEQALLAGTVLSGELRGAQGDSPVVGLYFNDAIAAKMGYYLQSDVVVSPTGCTVDGAPMFTVSVDLTSTAPADARSLPSYVTGTQTDVPQGELQTNVLLYAPEGGRVETVRLDGGPTGVFAQIHDGLAVVGRTVQLAPGATARLEYDVVGGPGQHGAPVVRTTPVTSATTSILPGGNCS